MKTKPIKARKIVGHFSFPDCWALRLDAESYDQMVAEITVALMQRDSCDYREDAHIALAALGITRPEPKE